MADGGVYDRPRLASDGIDRPCACGGGVLRPYCEGPPAKPTGVERWGW